MSTVAQQSLPFSAWAGPRNATTVLLGEAWGASEAEVKQPFAGESGKELWRMLGEAWPLDPASHLAAQALHQYYLAWIGHRGPWMEEQRLAFTNVFNFRPVDNKIENICGTKEVVAGTAAAQLPPLTKGRYLLPQYLCQLDRLRSELAECRPNLIVAMGNTACWAALRVTNIGQIRGAITIGHPDGVAPSIKVLPTYHPAGVLYKWDWRPIVVSDLMKAGRERLHPEIRRPQRSVIVNPTFDQAMTYLQSLLTHPPEVLGLDTETSLNMIDTFGFCRSATDALVIPFGPHRFRRGTSYVTVWPQRDGRRRVRYWDRVEEGAIWRKIKEVLESPVPKLFQNGMYDLQYILPLGIRPAALDHDTMLLHHSIFPEMQKGLGFLGSVYTEEASWKMMHKAQNDSEKRDE